MSILLDVASAKTGLQAFDLLKAVFSDTNNKTDFSAKKDNSAIFGDDDLNPNSPNYRYRDTGYIAGSRKEMAQLASERIKQLARNGELVHASEIDFDSIEDNPREAKALITKKNLLGKMNWQGLKDSGAEPAAAFLMDKVLSSIAQEPVNDTPQARKDFAIGIETIRARLEACKTIDDVTTLLTDISDEMLGIIFTLEESELYKKLMSEYLALKDAHDSAMRQLNVLKNKSKALPHPQNIKAYDDYVAKHPELVIERDDFVYSDGTKPYYPISKSRFLVQNAKIKVDAIRKQAEHREKESGYNNQATRSWSSFGKKFKEVAFWNWNIGNQTFRNHVHDCKQGKNNNWDWAKLEPKQKDESQTDTGGDKQKKTQFQLRVSDSYERVGGREIKVNSTNDLKNMFGLRDIQSGNWVLKDKSSAEFHLKQSAQAFADLADLIGVDDKYISMKGNLALAFGARGKSGALAHYEPVQRVINITKMNGGGSLAHEWFHAMDNMLSEVFTGNAVGVDAWLTEKPEKISHPELTAAFANLRKAMLEGSDRAVQVIKYTADDYRLGKANYDNPRSFQAKVKAKGNLLDAIVFLNENERTLRNPKSWLAMTAAYFDGNPEGGEVTIKSGQPVSKFLNDAIKLDNYKSGKYWSKPLEMAARAFAGWTEERLKQQGRKNHYLSNHSNNEAYKDMGVSPYPSGDEKTRIYKAFDDLFKVIRDTNALKTVLDSIFGG